MGRPKNKCAKCDFLSALEMERFDLSYKTINRPDPANVIEPVATVIDKPKRRFVDDDRDKLMFNAGRFAAGATDSVAIKANTVFQLVLGA